MKPSILVASLLTLISLAALGDEGMWLFNQFPEDKAEKKYGVEIQQSFLDHLRLSSVRVGASGSFVSPNGLVFTNHHVVLDCVQNVSSAEHDYVANGFYAKTLAEELKCPGTEANVLLKIEDVTARVNGAVKAQPAVPADLASDKRRCRTRATTGSDAELG